MKVGRWLFGIVVGTCIIAATSPWFVRSYVPRVVDPVRGATVLQPGASYRWRREGYATTKIGPLGMPGQTSFGERKSGSLSVALWGDSQAEGVCVTDDQKIAALAQRRSERQCHVLSFARSGDDCNDWIDQIRAIRSASLPELTIDAHVFLVVEWSDWCQPIERPEVEIDEAFNGIAATLPAFLIQVVRNALTTGDTNRPRTLRFRPGPVASGRLTSQTEARHDDPNRSSDAVGLLTRQLERLRRQTDSPCIFLYAPLSPSIVNGRIRSEDDEVMFDTFRKLCDRLQFHVVDLRGAMNASVRAGRWPRGFQHGQFGVGHFNAVGNRIIADHLVGMVEDLGEELWAED
jgi:lysophospholipase L1-like esterase